MIFYVCFCSTFILSGISLRIFSCLAFDDLLLMRIHLLDCQPHFDCYYDSEAAILLLFIYEYDRWLILYPAIMSSDYVRKRTTLGIISPYASCLTEQIICFPA